MLNFICNFQPHPLQELVAWRELLGLRVPPREGGGEGSLPLLELREGGQRVSLLCLPGDQRTQ